jgi:hypothetical protein
LVAADAVAAVPRTIAAQSANFITVNIFVSSFVAGHRCSTSGRTDVCASYVAHEMGWCRQSRTGRDTKAPGSIPGGGKQVREATRMSARHSPAVSRRTLGVLSFGWTRQRAEPSAFTRADEVIE